MRIATISLLLLSFGVSAQQCVIDCWPSKVFLKCEDYIQGWDYCGCVGSSHGDCSQKAMEAYREQREAEMREARDRIVRMLTGQRSKEREEAMQRFLDQQMNPHPE